jgi:hypothetical protein
MDLHCSSATARYRLNQIQWANRLTRISALFASAQISIEKENTVILSEPSEFVAPPLAQQMNQERVEWTCILQRLLHQRHRLNQIQWANRLTRISALFASAQISIKKKTLSS